MIAVPLNTLDEAKLRRIALIFSASVIALFVIITILIKFHIDMPVPEDLPPLKSDEVIETFEITPDKVKIADEGGSKGGGTQTMDHLGPPTPQSERVATQAHSDFHHFSGNSNNQNADHASGESSTTSQGFNPFGGTGGSGGGTGTGHGPFGGNGNGDGDGEGNGIGDGKTRVRLNNVDLPQYDVDFDSQIRMKLTVNANGDVIAATPIKSGTTCTDQRIINQVVTEVKRQVRYKKEPGAGLVYTYYTVEIDAR